MATNEEVLDSGLPAPSIEPGNDALRYGNAYLGVAGTAANPTQWGRYLRRIPDLRSSQSVSSDTHVVADPGLVTDVVATTATSTGAKRGKAIGGPDPGEVRISYASNGVATLLFAPADAVTVCAYHVLVTPQELIDFLDATSDPP